nr:hypothetical protein [Rhizobium laguerreae]
MFEFVGHPCLHIGYVARRFERKPGSGASSGFSKPWRPSLSSFSCRHIAYSGISVGSRSWLQGHGFIDQEKQENNMSGSIGYPA